MPRTNTDLVGAIVEVLDTEDVTPFIEAANAMVTNVCLSSSYSDDLLELIERWLAAHFYKVFNPETIQEVAGKVSEQYASRVDLGLKQTKYGQQAMRLDFKGNLAALDNALNKVTKVLGGLSPGITWLGKARGCEPCES